MSQNSNSWIKTSLAEISKIKGQYGANAPASIYKEGSPIYIRITDIDENGYLRYDSKVGVELEDTAHYLIEKGDLLFARTGATTGKCYLHRESNGKFVFAGFLIKYKIDEKKANPYYIWSLTKTNEYKNWVSQMSVRSGQPGINSREFGEFTFSLPSLKDQIKISEILSTWDKGVECLNKIILLLEKYKSSLFQQILKGKYYFSSSEGNNYSNWEYKKLREFWIEENEKTNINNQFEILTSTINDIFLQSEYFNKQIASDNNIGYKILKNERIVLSPQNAWMGNINVNTKYDIGIVSPSYKIYRLENADIWFFKELVKSDKFIKLIDANSQTGASIVRKSLRVDELLNSELLLPNVDEQRKIGEFLKTLDDVILKNKNLVIAYSKQKTGLMQLLLTGKVRVS